MFNLFILLIYKFLLDIIYMLDIAPYYWGYSGLVCTYDPFCYFLGWIFFISFAVLYKNLINQNWREYTPSNYFYLFVFLFSFTPGIIMYGAGCFKTEYLIYFLLFYFFLYCSYYFLDKVVIDNTGYFCGINSRKMEKILFYFFSIISIISVLFVFFNYDFSLFTKSLSDVYDQRALFKNIEMPKILSYILANACIINLIFIIYLIRRKRYIISLLILLIQYLLFSLDASKTVLFANFITLIFIVFNDKIKFKYLFYISFSLFIFTIIYSCFFPMTIPSGYIRRIMFIPNLLSYNYYDFFINHEPIYYILNRDAYPNLSYLIAGLYHNKPLMSANNGLVGDAFANLGYIGVIIYPLILSVYIKILDITCKNIESRYIAGLVLLVFITLQNSFFSTSMFSHGLFILLIMFRCFPIEYKVERR